jgi:pentatricopeptide repeat protein
MGAYNGRLTACLRDGQLERAVTLFEEMGQRRVPRNTHTLALGAEAMAR